MAKRSCMRNEPLAHMFAHRSVTARSAAVCDEDLGSDRLHVAQQLPHNQDPTI